MSSERNDRQSFLGENSQEKIEEVVVGVIGTGGGGSHVSQQLAHIGFKNYVIFDSDIPEESNLNRLVGATIKDVSQQRPKVAIAKRTIKRLVPKAKVEAYQTRWQDNPSPLRVVDLIFSCVDGFSERHEIEVFARRFLIPLIDIGMGVKKVGNEPPQMSGQIILSMPDKPCMWCLGFLSKDNLAKEAAKYGAVGNRPQVVWSNGVLASIAVGIGVELVTGWTQSITPPIYLSYDGNQGTITPHKRLQYLSNTECIHYSNQNVGDPVFIKF